MLKSLRDILSKNTINILWALLCISYPFNSKGGDLVAILDVGQGDSILIQRGDFQILVDGGPDLSAVYSLPKYMPIGDREIEVLVLTHPHADHIVGLLEVMKRYSVGEVWLHPVCYDNADYKNLLDSDVDIKYVNSSLEFTYEDLFIDVLWPVGVKKEVCSVGEYSSWDGNVNNDSVVMLLDYLGRRFLLMGDAEIPVEREIIELCGNYLDVDVLKVGHHCSKTSTCETLLEFAAVEYGVCSCSEANKFGHPDRGTVSRLQNFKVQIFKTYEDGDVVFR